MNPPAPLPTPGDLLCSVPAVLSSGHVNDPFTALRAKEPAPAPVPDSQLAPHTQRFTRCSASVPLPPPQVHHRPHRPRSADRRRNPSGVRRDPRRSGHHPPRPLRQRPRRDRRQRQSLSRALRLIQALITAAEAEGHSSSAGATGFAPPSHRRRRASPHFTITAQGQTVGFLALQEQDRTEHVATEKELADAKKQSRIRIPRFNSSPMDACVSQGSDLDLPARPGPTGRPETASTTCARWYCGAHSPTPRTTHQDPDQERTESAHSTFPLFIAGQERGQACTTSRRRPSCFIRSKERILLVGPWHPVEFHRTSRGPIGAGEHHPVSRRLMSAATGRRVSAVSVAHSG